MDGVGGYWRGFIELDAWKSNIASVVRAIVAEKLLSCLVSKMTALSTFVITTTTYALNTTIISFNNHFYKRPLKFC